MASLKDRIKEILLRDNLIDPAALEQALDEQRKTGRELSGILVARKLISEDVLTQVLSEGLGLPPINISRMQIDPKVIHLIPREMAEKYKVMPISLLGDNLTLAMADPLNIFAVDNVQALTGLTIVPIISRVKDVETAIQKYYSGAPAIDDKQETFADIMKDINKDTDEPELIKEGAAEDRGGIEEITNEAPIIKLADTIIQQAVYARASDVFIEPLEREMRVRYRVDGVIREVDRMSKVVHAPLISRIKVISTLDISEHRLPQDGRFKTIIAGNKEVDFRVSVLPTITGEKVVLRVLDQNTNILDLEKLGFEPSTLQRLKACADRPHGMILTCGPTGSGKTTTLYSVLKHVDSPGLNIVTVEDPVEYQMKGLNQVNVKPALGLTFGASLRSILRQDPDIIMIGEIRDSETLDIAVKAALTGHLVLSSLHTTTAAGSVIRMMNMGIEPFLICSSVLAILAQRLLRRVCESCKEKYELNSAVVEKIGLARLFPQQKSFELFRGKGCQKCLKTGYKGRVGIHEILSFTPKVRELVLARAGEFKIKQAGRSEGMYTMREDGLFKAVAGLTTLEEVLRVTASDDKTEDSTS